MSPGRSASYPTEKQLEKAINILNKRPFLTITATDTDYFLRMLKQVAANQSSEVNSAFRNYLVDLYVEKFIKVAPQNTFDFDSSRNIQKNGIVMEADAIKILSEVDNYQYEKNKKQFENGYFVGKPDILCADSIKEIKTFMNFRSIMKMRYEKPAKSAQYQLQSYMDVSEIENGEIIYVVTGMSEEYRASYLEKAKVWYESFGKSPAEVSKKVKKLEMESDLTKIPMSARILRVPFKKNKELIRFSHTKVTAARKMLSKIHDDYEKIVGLGGDSEQKDESI